MTHTSHHQQPIKIAKLALIATATVAATVALPATGRADDNLQKFQSPSGNIRCLGNAEFVACEIRDYTYVPPTGILGCQSGEFPRGNEMQLGHGGAYMYCPGSAFDSGPWPTLDYGQTRSFGLFTCDSELAGVTCTDSSTDHLLRLSRDSYQLG